MPENSKTSFGAKRGRPKRETLPDKIREGEENEGAFKCPECKRLFPRSKSLNAHVRIHNNVRPYLCDYPNCAKAFRQSGQLRTHQRTHTREKLFACPFPACETRFIHINRQCPLHPKLKLKRDGKGKVCRDVRHLSFEEVIWLERYGAKKNSAKRRQTDSVNTFISPGINRLPDSNSSDSNSSDANSSDTNSSDANSSYANSSEDSKLLHIKADRNLKLDEVETIKVLINFPQLSFLSAMDFSRFFEENFGSAPKS